MYGKIYESTFTGSMVGTGAATFAVWGYVIANTKPDSMVELNPVLIAAMIGEDVSRIEEAIAKLCDIDERSRTKKHQGRRMIKRGEFLYYVPNHQKYRGIPNDTERKQYFARKQREHRQRVAKEPVKPLCQTKSKPVKQAEAVSRSIKQEKEGANGSRPQSVEDWLKELEADKTYQGIDVRREYGKMLNWCKLRSKKPTQRRFINWLNNAEKTLPAQHAAKPDYKRNYAPAARQPTEAELANARRIAHEETARFKEQFK